MSLVSSFNEHLIKKQTWIPNFGSLVAVIGLVMLDIIVPLYHSVRTQVVPPLRPSYDAYIIFAIYTFLPIPENLHSVILGMSTTFCYLIVTYFITYRSDDHALIKVIHSWWTWTNFIFSFIISFIMFFYQFNFHKFYLGLHRSSVLAWYQFFWSVCTIANRGGNSKGISWPSWMCWREFIIAICSWSRSM